MLASPWDGWSADFWRRLLLRFVVVQCISTALGLVSKWDGKNGIGMLGKVSSELYSNILYLCSTGVTGVVKKWGLEWEWELEWEDWINIEANLSRWK